jgi:predicted RNase H-like HicB family nuclease
MKIKVIVHPAAEGGYWAEVPALRGCYSQGETMEEMLANIREAIECWLDAPTPTELPGAAHVEEIEV